MIEKTRVVISRQMVPYYNMGLEAYLLYHVEPGECILYLWQNRRTVVIGKNQNSWKECKVHRLEEDGGYLARRLSGGGAVFHDEGNLNFTFLVRRADYDVEKQMEVVLQAVRMYGVDARRTGRNDLVVEGKKFSGHAFYQSGDFCYHHGTILLHVNKEDMSKYLQVSDAKLKSKGVDSVRSRVENLSVYVPRITVTDMEQCLIAAFSRVYEREAAMLPESRLNREEIQKLTDGFASWQWRYGRKIPFQYQAANRYSWGEVEIQIDVNEGVLQHINLYSDSLDTELLERIRHTLEGQIWKKDILSERWKQIDIESPLQEAMTQDILGLLATCL